jgi:hypothetical protein
MRLVVSPPCTARHHHSLWLRAREGPGVRLLFDLLPSCSGLLKHAAATTPAAVTVPTLTFNALQSCTPRVRPCAVDAARVAVAETAPTAEAYDAAAVQAEVAAARGAVARAEGDAATALPPRGRRSRRRSRRAD